MIQSLGLFVLLACGTRPAWGAMPVMVQDFEKTDLPPTVWVVNIPQANALVQLSTAQPHDGKQCLKLHYHFLGTGNFQYLGIPSTWFETFHTYGCEITETDTIYYCDDIEVGRHATFRLSKELPLFFLINLATGGGWPVDLSRYHGVADMYVDYVRVYQGKKRAGHL